MFDSLISYGVGGIVASVFSLTFVVTAIVLGVILYCTVFSKKNDGKYTGFMGKLYDFMTFKKLSIEPLLKLGYIILAIYTTLDAFVCFKSGILSGTTSFFYQLVIRNITLRILFELAMLLVKGCKNLAELNAKTSGSADNVNKEFEEQILGGMPAAPAQQNTAPVQPVQQYGQPMQQYGQPMPQPVPQMSQPMPQPVPQPVPPVSQPVPQPVPPMSQPMPQPVPQPVPQPAPSVELSKQSAPADAAEYIPCPKCGKEIKAAARFCPFCGNQR